MDRISPERRSALMSKVRSKNSLIELALRRELWRRGYRYRIHVRSLPGTPDIVFQRAKVAIFVDSEFWHGYNWAVREQRIGTNREFWIPKIEATIQRDKEVTEELQRQGWTVLRFWGNEVKKGLHFCVECVERSLTPTKSD